MPPNPRPPPMRPKRTAAETARRGRARFSDARYSQKQAAEHQRQYRPQTSSSCFAWQTPDMAARGHRADARVKAPSNGTWYQAKLRQDDHSVTAMKPTTLFSCSVLTRRSRSVFGSFAASTRTRYNPPADGPPAILSLLVSKNWVTSAAAGLRLELDQGIVALERCRHPDTPLTGDTGRRRGGFIAGRTVLLEHDAGDQSGLQHDRQRGACRRPGECARRKARRKTR